MRASPRRVAAGASSQQRPRSVATRRSAPPRSRLAPDAAAVRIQATYRGAACRTEAAAVRIQCAVRRRQAVKQVRVERMQRAALLADVKREHDVLTPKAAPAVGDMLATRKSTRRFFPPDSDDEELEEGVGGGEEGNGGEEGGVPTTVQEESQESLEK